MENIIALPSLSGSIMTVVKSVVSVGTTIVGLVLGHPVGTILTVGGIIATIGNILSVSLSMRSSRKSSSTKGKK